MEEIKDDLLNHLYEAEEHLMSRMGNICDGCERIIDYVPLEHFGTPCVLEQQACDPGELCWKAEEYEEIRRLLNIVRNTQNAIEPEAVLA